LRERERERERGRERERKSFQASYSVNVLLHDFLFFLLFALLPLDWNAKNNIADV
jgi:hypothetical protein